MLYLAMCDEENRIYKNEELIPVVRSGDDFFELLEEDVIPLPEGASIMRLPDRFPVAIDAKGEFMVISQGATDSGEGPVNAACAILPQGYLRTYLPAYISAEGAEVLPLFGYTALAYRDDELVIAAVRTDDRDSWDPKYYNTPELEILIDRMTAQFPENRIVKQLAHCAVDYQCFTAQNVFYERSEGGIPVSPKCNANCLGCISLQPSECCKSPQMRIDFVPTVKEVTEVLINHLDAADGGIISFGQGCEGEPTLQYKVIAESIKETRRLIKRGTINVNTNAGFTEAIKEIVEAGVDSLRVSLISALKASYDKYYKPSGYSIEDVKESIKFARSKGVFVSLNYLVFPGFSDQQREVEAMTDFISSTDINMIQFRNLNIDPEQFMKSMASEKSEAYGMLNLLTYLKECFPEIVIGNFSVDVNSVE